MESFLWRKLAQAGGNILGGSTLQKPISSYQAIKLPDLSSSFYSIADEPFPQVSGFLDDTVDPSFIPNETGTVLNSPACTTSENKTKNADDSVLKLSLRAPCQLAEESTSTRSLQNEKDISATADKADGHCNDPIVSTLCLEKSDFMSAELKNSTFDVTQDSKERSDTGVNTTVDLQNIREKNVTFESQESKEGSEPNSTVDIVMPNIKAESGNTTVDLVQSHDLKESPDNGVNSASYSVEITKPIFNIRETEAEISTSAFVCSVDTPNDAPELKAEEHHNTTERPGLADVESVPSSDISRSSIFCLDDTLDLKTSFIVTSTPIVFGKESRFETLRDARPTTLRKRLSVINSIEAQSNDELVGVSNHNVTDAVQATESSRQKVSANCSSSQRTSEPANENKPPTKLPIKRQLPQLSSKLSYPKSSLPPRPQSSLSSSVVVKPKSIQGPQAGTGSHPDTSSTALLGKRNPVQMNKGKNIAPVKSAASASTVKTSMVSSIPGYNFTAVAKASSSGGIPQMKQSGLKPPTRNRVALKTPQTTRSSIETIQTQTCNKPTAELPGMRTRNSLLSSVGQKRLNNDGMPSAKRKRIAQAALSTAESDAAHPADGAHQSGCADCLQHKEKLERILQELMGLRSECTNWAPLQDKLEMCVREMKRF